MSVVWLSTKVVKMKTFEDATYSQKYGVGKIYANTLKCLLGG